jgi:fibronectin type 3 domain-containing protein
MNKLTTLLITFCIFGVTYFVLPANAAVIDPPDNITATVSGYAKRINVSWDASTTQGSSYRLYRSADGEGLGEIVVNDSFEIAYTDENVAYNQFYYYYVRALNGADESELAGPAQAKPVLPVPTNVSALDTQLGRQIKVNWSRPSLEIILTYNVYRSTQNNSSGERIANNVAGTEFLDTNVEDKVFYYYSVKSVSEDGAMSDSSNFVSAVSHDTVGSGPPTNLWIEDLGGGKIKVIWAAPAGDSIDHFLVYKNTSSIGLGTQITSTVEGYYTDGNVVAGSTYYYRVKAVDQEGNVSVASDAVRFGSGVTGGGVEDTAGIKAEGTGADGEISVSWDAPTSSNYSHMIIYRNDFSGSLGSVAADRVQGTSFTDRGLVNGKTYYYIVRSVSKGGVESQLLDEVFSAPFISSGESKTPPPVKRLRVQDVGDGEILYLTWLTPVLHEYKYLKIYRSDVKGVLGEPIVNWLRDNEYEDTTGISEGVSYYYTVKTTDANGVESINNLTVRGIATEAFEGETGNNDSDGDGLPDIWERKFGFHVRLKDLVNQDDDSDGLGTYAEFINGTDPWNPDSDGDGYTDGTEILNEYNPLGVGRVAKVKEVIKKVTQGDFAYKKNRLSSIKDESDLAGELRSLLEFEFGEGRIPNPRAHWHKLVNAYIYGGYTAQEIAHTLQKGPGLVHPTVPADAWRQTDEYKKKNK